MRLKASVFALFTLLMVGCAGRTTIIHAPGPVMAPGALPIGFWKTKEAVVQVRYSYKELVPDLLAGTAVWTKRSSLGTGVVVEADGIVLTNNHVVEAGFGDTIKPIIKDEKFLVCKVPDGILDCKEAKVLATDPNHDLAFVKANTTFSETIEFGDDTTLVAAAQVYTWGNAMYLVPIAPLFGRFIGWIAAPYVNPTKVDVSLPLLLVDLSTVGGYSGGPVLDMSGKLVGLESMHTSADNGRPLGIAIPVSAIKKFYKKSDAVLHSTK